MSDSDTPVLGAMSRREAAAILRDLGENEAAELLERDLTRSGSSAATSRGGLPWPFQDRPWQYTEHAFGFIPPSEGDQPQRIRFAGNMKPDKTLAGSQIKITLNKLRVADYPGGSEHQLLFEFAARNQTEHALPEDAHYNVFLRAREGQSAAVVGLPVFAGLTVGAEGVAFHCQVVNVRNSDDERLLEFMESSTFQGGLQLMKTLQPAIAPLAQMSVGLTRGLLKRNRNVKVQEFHLGLDFSNVPTGARLAEGAYIVVQIPDTIVAEWSWDDWVYQPYSGNIVAADDGRTLIGFNYVVLGISRMGQPIG